MDDILEQKVVIRVYNEDRDIEGVLKLEKDCNIGFKKGISTFTSMIDDPLRRIRLYPTHIMLVMELLKNGELVGMVQGCIKCVGTKIEGRHIKLGCILGLRVSPRNRRMGIGLKLVQSMEEWMTRNGAHYAFLATEEENVSSTNLFSLKCNYIKFSSLIIYVQPVHLLLGEISQDIKTERLPLDQAISFYKNHCQSQDIYPVDMDEILKEELSLGTWVSYYKKEGWTGLDIEKKNEDSNNVNSQDSWVIFSIWNTWEAYKLQMKSAAFKLFHATLAHAKNKIFHCFKVPLCCSLDKCFGFLFLYGLHGKGEGDKLGELMRSVWNFTSRLAQNVNACKVVMTELGFSDPLREYVPQGSSMSCINDIWYIKCMKDPNDDESGLALKKMVGNVFVDPRDF